MYVCVRARICVCVCCVCVCVCVLTLSVDNNKSECSQSAGKPQRTETRAGNTNGMRIQNATRFVPSFIFPFVPFVPSIFSRFPSIHPPSCFDFRLYPICSFHFSCVFLVFPVPLCSLCAFYAGGRQIFMCSVLVWCNHMLE